MLTVSIFSPQCKSHIGFVMNLDFSHNFSTLRFFKKYPQNPQKTPVLVSKVSKIPEIKIPGIEIENNSRIFEILDSR